ncbi:MAG: LacI family transcriptional regulator [Glaciecola sp.]|jgi:LacI family transcriptional regulator
MPTSAPLLTEGTIGYIVHDFSNPYFADVARYMEATAEASGFAFVLAQSRGSAERELSVARMLADNSVDGLIISPADTRPEHLANLDELPVRLVLLDVDTLGDHCSVYSDNVEAGNLAGQHLLGLGHEKIVVVTPPMSIQSCAERVGGLRQAVADAGHDPDDVVTEVMVPFANAREGKGAVRRVLSHKPTAVFCINDLLALGLMSGLVSAKVRVPEDIALMGCDDVEFAHSLETPLTTLRLPKKEVAAAAASLLIEELTDSRHRHRSQNFATQLVARASTKAS